MNVSVTEVTSPFWRGYFFVHFSNDIRSYNRGISTKTSVFKSLFAVIYEEVVPIRYLTSQL